MPAARDYTIDLIDADSDELDADQGKKIVWHNSSASSIVLHPPSCVSPGQDETISPNSDSKVYTVNGKKGDVYTYTFDVGAEVGTRNGTIKVNP